MSCNSLMQNSSIEYIYHDKEFIISNQVETECLNEETKKALIYIFDKNENTLLIRPIERTYFKEKELHSKNGNYGKVVKHDYFILKNEFHGNNIATKIHKNEIQSYKNNNFIEIHLDAAWDGLIVWKKLFFKFVNQKQENYIKMAIHLYLKNEKGFTIQKIAEIIKNNPFNINMEYLKSENGLDFKDWVHNNPHIKIGLASMYKEIS